MLPFRVSVLVFFCLFVAILSLQWLNGERHEEIATYPHVSVIGDLLRSPSAERKQESAIPIRTSSGLHGNLLSYRRVKPILKKPKFGSA